MTIALQTFPRRDAAYSSADLRLAPPINKARVSLNADVVAVIMKVRHCPGSCPSLRRHQAQQLEADLPGGISRIVTVCADKAVSGAR